MNIKFISICYEKKASVRLILLTSVEAGFWIGFPNDGVALLAPNAGAVLLAPNENDGAVFDAVAGAGAIDEKLAEPKAGAAGVDEDGVALKLNDVNWLLLFVPNENAGADAAALVDCGFVARVLLLLPNGFVVLFGCPNTNGVADNEGAAAVVLIVGTLKRFGSVDTSVL